MKTLSEIKKLDEQDVVLIQLADDEITNVVEDSFAERGCYTCDYGSNYGYEYTVHFSSGDIEKVKIGEEYDSPISEGELMIFLLNNLDELKLKTKKEFLDLFKDFNTIRENIVGW